MRNRWNSIRAEAVTLRQRFQFVPVVTLVCCTVIVVAAVQLGVFSHELPLLTGLHYGFSGRLVWSVHRWSSLWTSALLSRDAFMAISLAVSIAAMLGVYEAIAGWRRTFTVAAGAAVLGPMVVAGIVQLAGFTGNSFALRTTQTVDYGASTISASAGGAIAALAGPTLRRTLIIWLVIGSLLHHQLADAEHIVSFVFGFFVSRAWTPTTFATATRSRKLRRVALVSSAALVGILIGMIATPGTHLPIASAAVRHGVPTRTGPGQTVDRGSSAPNQTGEAPTSTRSQPAAPIRVEKRSYPTPSIGGSQTVYVILPAGYDQDPEKRYPVVELLHGHPGSAIDMVTGLDVPAFMNQPGTPPFIALAPDGIGPVVADSFYADTSLQHVGTAVSTDLVTWANTQLRGNRQWSIGGLSAGGYGAAYLATSHPDIYRAGCSMSGNFSPEGRTFANQNATILEADTPLHHAGPTLPPMLLIVGDHDQTGLADANRYHRAMTAAGQTSTVVIGPGGHDWSLWRAELATCLSYLLNPPNSYPVPRRQ